MAGRGSGCFRDLPDLRAFFTGFTEAFGFFIIRGRLSSMMNCFPHFGQVRRPSRIVSITVAIIKAA
jgi:hypothetical protein